IPANPSGDGTWASTLRPETAWPASFRPGLRPTRGSLLVGPAAGAGREAAGGLVAGAAPGAGDGWGAWAVWVALPQAVAANSPKMNHFRAVIITSVRMCMPVGRLFRLLDAQV